MRGKTMKFTKTAAAVALAAALLGAGCATEHYEMDAKHPAAVMMPDGWLEFRGKFYKPEQLPRAFRKAGIPSDRMINIRVPETIDDPMLLRKTRALIGQSGYRRVIFVTERHSRSTQADGKDPFTTPGRNFPPGEKVYGAGW